MREYGHYEAFRDFGSKSAENAARIAAVFQACKGTQLISIDKESMESGNKVAHWYLNEAVRYFGPLTPTAQKKTNDAKSLLDFLLSTARKKSQNSIERSFVMSYGPTSLRKKEKFDPLIRFLEQNHYIRTLKTHKAILEINPSLLE